MNDHICTFCSCVPVNHYLSRLFFTERGCRELDLRFPGAAHPFTLIRCRDISTQVCEQTYTCHKGCRVPPESKRGPNELKTSATHSSHGDFPSTIKCPTSYASQRCIWGKRYPVLHKPKPVVTKYGSLSFENSLL